jgi:predicted branched-subunit amino acid permease
MAMYSASLASHFSGLPTRWKGLLAYFLTDQAYAVAIARFSGSADDVDKKWYYLGAGFLLWLVWVTGSATGAFLGAALPKGWSLDFAVPLTFLALIIPVIRDLPAAIAAIAAAVVAVAAHGLPYNTWLLLAASSGIAAGFFLERIKEA